MTYKTAIGSLNDYEMGTIDVNDDIRHYAFSNIFEVANQSKPFERVMVTTNLEYCVEVVRIEGESPWYTAPHDEFAIVMDGEVEFTFFKLEEDEKPAHEAGAVRMNAEPRGKRMGRVVARRGHEVLLPQGAAYQMTAGKPAVAIMQTLEGPESVQKWSEICVLK